MTSRGQIWVVSLVAGALTAVILVASEVTPYRVAKDLNEVTGKFLSALDGITADKRKPEGTELCKGLNMFLL